MRFAYQRGETIQPTANAEHLILLIMCAGLVPKMRVSFPNSNGIIIVPLKLNLIVGSVLAYDLQVVSRRRDALTYSVPYACFWIVFIYPPKGFNYNIYTFNASLTIYGQKAFDRIDSQSNDETKVSFRDAKYLDYTGMQHLLYVLLEYIDLYKFSSKLSAFGFRLWIILNFSLIILLIFYLNNSTEIEIGASKIYQ
ncbi:MAG: hypothetical protein LC122_02905 [Chitinophagales bacterium]|nr:hypothetical protein [Chitinophagales bacterium]